MNCPECNSRGTQVLDSRHSTCSKGPRRRRRRLCRACGHRWTTHELSTDVEVEPEKETNEYLGVTDETPRVITSQNLNRLLKAVELLRVLESEMTTQTAVTFLYVAAHDGCNKYDLEVELGFTTATGSRNCAYLDNKDRPGKKALRLIKRQVHPYNHRMRTLHLTPEGKRIANKLDASLYF